MNDVIPTFDAMTASESDFKAAVARMAREHARRQVEAEQAAFLAALKKKYESA